MRRLIDAGELEVIAIGATEARPCLRVSEASLATFVRQRTRRSGKRKDVVHRQDRITRPAGVIPMSRPELLRGYEDLEMRIADLNRAIDRAWPSHRRKIEARRDRLDAQLTTLHQKLYPPVDTSGVSLGDERPPTMCRVDGCPREVFGWDSSNFCGPHLRLAEGHPTDIDLTLLSVDERT